MKPFKKPLPAQHHHWALQGAKKELGPVVRKVDKSLSTG